MEQCSKFCVRKVASKGFQFQPSKIQICEIYLKSKIEGKMLPCKHMIFDENLYEDHSTPWEIFKSDDSRWLLSSESSKKKTKKVIYVFTMLKKKGERVIRKAGCGTWTGQNKKEVRQGGTRIGFDSLLTFKIKDDKKINVGGRGNWTMHEYCLDPNDYNCAICKITKEEDASENVVASSHNESLVKEELSTGILDSEVPVYDCPYENMFNQENPVQGQPPLEFPNEMDVLKMQELCEENMINELLQPQRIEDNWAQKLDAYLAYDPFFKPTQDYEETKDMQVYCPLPNNNQVLVAEQEQRQQQGERISNVGYLDEKFDFSPYDQPKQHLEGGQNNSLEKRKIHSYHEEEFSKNKKQLHSFVSSLP
ncbi:hypothetical protein POM88_000408 [Heracleum sosnowskyi]|uniref:NAC domain-containing protein n=1 Tax=Heracleum sosnowskyi TaxID=360622 RepID=A0AAD8NAT5_9APIA|nr:hypothetical protein POM88_000408 [Heracleum sosnowskyi]